MAFATDIVRFSKEQLEAAQIQAEQEAAAEAQMQNDNDTVDKDKLREIVLRRDIDFDERNGTLIYGKPQNTNPKVQADDVNPHAVAVKLKADELVNSGDYELVAMNLSWRTATGRRATSSGRPDIIAVKKDGSVLGIEFRSPSQDADVLKTKLEGELDSFSDAPANRRLEVYDLSNVLERQRNL
ncbi:MAG: hypothetical protein ACKV2Q_30835 [Planctomycetaceae bacterium]